MIRKIDELGRLVLPLAARRALGLQPGSGLQIEWTDDCILLRPAEPEQADGRMPLTPCP